jgi:hypothetical protein
MDYGEHLVFALHVHSFWFFLAFATALLPDVIGQWLALGLANTVPYSLVIGVGAAGLALALLST